MVVITKEGEETKIQKHYILLHTFLQKCRNHIVDEKCLKLMKNIVLKRKQNTSVLINSDHCN